MLVEEEEINETPENYGLKSLNGPPQIKESSAIGNELINWLKITKFRKVQNEFQRKLKENIELINSESKTLTFTDRITNLYKLEKEQYNKLLKGSITTTYKIVKRNIRKQMNLEGKNIIKDKTIGNSILVNDHVECFISLKNHKPNFTNNPKARLINSAKNEMPD